MDNQVNLTLNKKNILKETPIYIGVSVALFALLILSIGLAVTIGSVDISIGEVYSIILNKSSQNGYVHDVIWFCYASDS